MKHKFVKYPVTAASSTAFNMFPDAADMAATYSVWIIDPEVGEVLDNPEFDAESAAKDYAQKEHRASVKNGWPDRIYVVNNRTGEILLKFKHD